VARFIAELHHNHLGFQELELAGFVLDPETCHQIHHRIGDIWDTDTFAEFLIRDAGQTPRAGLKDGEVAC
jgi:hypothetical protein